MTFMEKNPIISYEGGGMSSVWWFSHHAEILRRHELGNYKIMELVGNFPVKLFSTMKC